MASAGHPFPWHYQARDREIIQSESTGMALGIEASYDYPTVSASLEKGDKLVLCTDGVLEARDAQGKQYGDQRLSQLLQHHAAMEASGLCQTILDDVKRHRGSVLTDDDVSFVAVQVF